MTDNSIQLKKDLEMFLYQLRIHAEVYIEEMVCNINLVKCLKDIRSNGGIIVGYIANT